MSPNHVIPPDFGALSPIAERVRQVGSLTHDFSASGLVLGVQTDLLVRRQHLDRSRELRDALQHVADYHGNLAEIATRALPTRDCVVPHGGATPGTWQQVDADYEPQPDGPLSQLELWRLKDGSRDALDESRRLRRLVPDEHVRTASGAELVLPAVAPNHAGILAPHAGGCPATPPQPAPAPPGRFVEQPASGPAAKVTILDSGYIHVPMPNTHRDLDARVTLVRGQSLTNTNPPGWTLDEPDGRYTDRSGRLDGISGHGTFIAGLIAHIAPEARLEVVGMRNQEVEIDDTRDPAEQLGLFHAELSIALAMLRRGRTDVIQCGFAFPTLDEYPSLPFAAVLEELRQPNAPRDGHVAVVAPAGNEQSRQRYWPAALPDVVGVASTNRRGDARSWFSNWGDWCDCCSRGEYVYSTFIDWTGPVEGERITDVERFLGWAHWDGTSFAAPKVSAEIARQIAADPDLLPTEAWNRVRASAIDSVTDFTLSPHHGVKLPRVAV